MSQFVEQGKEDLKRTGDHFVVYLKWMAIALIIGGILGTVAAAFYHGLTFVTNVREKTHWLVFLLPAGGLLIAFLYNKLDKAPLDGNNKGTNMVLAAVNSKEDVPLRMTFLIFISSMISHLFGASVGREGAALQMGASIGNTIGKGFRLNENDKRIAIMAGMAAGFGGIFGAPITAAVFAMEVISVGVMYYAALLPCIVASLTSMSVARALGVHYVTYADILIPKFTPFTASMTMLLGVMCALLSIVICVSLIVSEKVFQTVFQNTYVQIFVAGTMVSLATLLVGNQAYNGLGAAAIAAAAAGQTVWYAFLLKLAFTAVSLAGGYRGGEIIPSLFIGATFGCWMAPLLGMPASLGAALGMIAVFCGVTNSPIAAFLMGMELFRGKGMWFFGIAVAVSYMLSDYYGLYKSQLIIYSKYRSVYIRRRTNR